MTETSDGEEGRGEGRRRNRGRRNRRQPPSRSERRRRQADAEGRQEARLGDAGRTERGAAVRRDFLRPDRGHERDAQRDGHQRRGQRGRRRSRKGDRAESADEEEAEGGEIVEASRSTAVATRSSEPAERTDDPVRMYLREMGSVELLSREGEIAIAKRIEAGREAMIAGLCESPLTFQAIIIWRDELNEGKILLRDIIDLEASYTGPDGKKPPKTDYTAPGAPPAPNPVRDRIAPATAPAAPPEGFEGEAGIPVGRLRRRRRSRKFGLALGHGSRPQAARARDLRPHRRRLQETAPPAGPERREQAQERIALAGAGAQVQGAEERDRHRRQVAVAQPEPHRRAGRAALRHQQAADRPRRAPDADGGDPSRQPRGLSARTTRTRSSIRSGSCASRG